MQPTERCPIDIIPPDGKDYPQLTFVFANGVRIYHGGGWGGLLSSGARPARSGARAGQDPPVPDIPHHSNYKGHGGIFGDFLYCVRTRERPFRDIELGHRAALALSPGEHPYWLNRRLKWDPDKEVLIGNVQAERWLDRPMREPWRVS